MGNKGVEQLTANFFRKCGIFLSLLPLVLALFGMMGCIERAPDLLSSPINSSSIEAAEETPSRLQMDFDSEVNSHLFRVWGDLLIFGNRSLPYLMLNATLREGGKTLQSTKYLMIDLQPGGDHSFEIAKDMRIDPGDYACTLEISGPAGTLASETRRCQANEPWVEEPSAIASSPVQEQAAEIIEFYSRQQEAARAEEDTAGKEAQEDEEPPSRGSSVSSSAHRLVENVSPTRSNKSVDPPKIKSAEQESEAEQDARLVGSSSSKKYHLPDCRYALKIKADKKISFASREDAERQGYLPCKVCNP